MFLDWRAGRSGTLEERIAFVESSSTVGMTVDYAKVRNPDGCRMGSTEAPNEEVAEFIAFRLESKVREQASNHVFYLSRSSGAGKHHTTTSPYLLASSCQCVLKPLQHSLYNVPARYLSMVGTS